MSEIADNEVWKDVSGYEGYYRVSNLGRVESLVGWNGQKYIKRKRIVDGWIQKTSKNSSYKRRVVSLAKDGDRKVVKIHRLVAEHFIPKNGERPNINHKDGNPLNNRADNLEWCTQKENMVHAINTGLVSVGAYENEKEVVKMYKNGASIRRISAKFASNCRTVKKVLKRNGLEVKNPGHYQNKYHIDREALIKEFEKGNKNTDIAVKFGTNRHLIGTYKHKWKKGELVK